MSYYWVGDSPVTALVLVPTRAGTPIDLSDYTGVSAILVKPNGLTVLVDTVAIAEDAIEVTFPPPSWFTASGLYQLRMALQDDAGHRERLDAIPLIVQDDDGWHTLPSIRSEWRDAPDEDMQLWVLLETAKREVLAFAPALDDDELPPLAYREAQKLQARNRWNAGRVDPSTGDAGGDGFSLTPFPLDWTVKQLLRPKTARPVAL